MCRVFSLFQVRTGGHHVASAGAEGCVGVGGVGPQATDNLLLAGDSQAMKIYIASFGNRPWHLCFVGRIPY